MHEACIADRLLPPHRDCRGKPVVTVAHGDPSTNRHDHLTKLTCDDPICRCTGERSHALSLVSSVSCFGWNERGVSAWGLAQCHDTDDTNRGSGDTRTIRWMVKMARSETFQMSADWLPERRLLSEWRHETVPTEPPRSRRRNMAAASRLETDHGPQSPAAVLYSVNPGASKYVAAPASRGCCRCN